MPPGFLDTVFKLLFHCLFTEPGPGANLPPGITILPSLQSFSRPAIHMIRDLPHGDRLLKLFHPRCVQGAFDAFEVSVVGKQLDCFEPSLLSFQQPVEAVVESPN